MKASLVLTWRIVALYIVGALLWMVLTDWLLPLWQRDERLDTLKDLTFVLFTALLLFFFLRRYFSLREQEAEKLRLSEEQYRSVVTSLSEGVLVEDQHGRPLALNASGEKLFGLTFSQLTSPQRDPRWKILDAQGQLLPRAAQPSAVALRTKQPQRDVIIGVAKPLGEVTWLSVNSQPILTPDTQELRGVVTSFTNITEKRAAEAALLQSEARYRQLLDLSPILIAVYSEGKVVFLNQAGAHILGAANPQQLVNNSILDFVLPEDHAEFRRRFAELLTLDQPVEWGETRLRRLDGSPLIVQATIIPFNNNGVRAVQLIGMDISARYQAEESLRQSETMFRLLAENAHDVIYRLSYIPTVHYDYISPSIYNLVGYEAAEFYRDPELRLKILHPEDRVNMEYDSFPGGRVANIFIARMLHRTGEVIWTETHRTLEFNERGELIAAEGVLRNITDRKNYVDQLRLQSTALEAAANAIVITDINGDIVWVNPAYTLLTGYTFAEAKGRSTSILKSGAQSSEWYAQMWAMIRAGQVWHGEIINRRKNGELYSEDMIITPVPNEVGEIVNFVAIKQDITERKKAEEARTRLASILETTTDFVATFDLNWRLTYINQAGREMLALSAEEDFTTLRLPHYYSPWAVETLTTVGFPKARAEGVWSGETSLVTRQGQEIPVSQLIVAQKNEQGVVEFFSSIMRDITDRKHRERELLIIVSITNALRAAVTHDQMLPVVLDKTVNLLKIDGAILAIEDTRIPGLFIELGRGAWSDVANTHLMSHESLTHHVLETMDVYVSNDVMADKRFIKPEALNRMQAVVCAPLIAEGRAIGVLWTGRRAVGGEFTANDLMLLDAITSIAANAIYRATLFDQAQQRAEQLAAVNRLGRALAETYDLPNIYTQMSEAIVRLLPYIAGLFISLYDAEQQQIKCAYGMMDGQLIDPATLPVLPLEPLGVGTQSEVIHTQRPLIINNLAERLRHSAKTTLVGDSSQVTQAGLYAPLLVQGKVIGVIQVQSYVANRFTTEDADLLSSVANTSAIAIENARLFAETAKRMEYLLALRNIDLAISASVDTRFTLNVVLDQMRIQLRVDAACVLLSNPQTQMLEYAAGKGFRQRHIERTRLRWGDGVPGEVALNHTSRFVPDISKQGGKALRDDVLQIEGIVSYYVVPLIVKGKVEGVLEIFQRTSLNPDREWQEFLESLAAQAAVAIDNALMFDRLQRSNAELTLAYDTTLEGWSRALDLRDRETEGHTLRVTELTLILARYLNISEEDLVHIRRGAILHDIGKIGVPDSILLKPAPLTPEELEIMQRHPTYAYEFLSSVPFLRAALDIPYCHHEHYDGNGYPRKLKGEAIPLAARIFAVVDVWDAMRSNRPYRLGLSKAEVCQHLRDESGKYFDPNIVAAFLELVEQQHLDV